MTRSAPRGGSDILARLIGPQVTETFGQPVVIDNRPGGAGTIATTATVRAAYNVVMRIAALNASYAVN